ncbi:MAG: GTPase HflX [Deltaproteobacteria bacterium]|nr:GTPase HflX [Deltaproteobacteria bacterium]
MAAKSPLCHQPLAAEGNLMLYYYPHKPRKQRTTPIPQIFGNTSGLKASELKNLERIYRRKVPREALVTPELARYMTELSREMKRQIGVIINRKGAIVAAILGDEKEIFIPALEDYRLGRSALRGIRCVHTHIKGEALTQDDLTDLALLRLDAMAAIEAREDGLPGTIYTAHLVPYSPEAKAYEVAAPVPFQRFPSETPEYKDFNAFVTSLEGEMGRALVRNVADKRERAVLVSVSMKPVYEQEESLKELKSLAETNDVLVLDSVCQRIKQIDPRYMMGSGKIKELIITSLQREATLLIFDQELSPAQIREIGDITELKVIDRTQLILDIFARRAHSRDGKVQVELAQLRYRLPKLTGKGVMMSRLMGGIGGRGPGETKLEVDRRRVQDRITHLEKELKTLSLGRLQRRQRRGESGVPIISIVGYTNAGKSTLLNALTRSTTLTENKLFATLDTASRRLRFPKERDAVITDTVGFIKDMPEELKKAFKSTLEEMKDANLLLHVVDSGDEDFSAKMETVEKILAEMELGAIPKLVVFNKADLVDADYALNLAKRFDGVAISAANPATFAPLLERVKEKLWPEG